MAIRYFFLLLAIKLISSLPEPKTNINMDFDEVVVDQIIVSVNGDSAIDIGLSCSNQTLGVSEGPGEPEVTEEPEQPDEPEDTEKPDDAVSEGPGEPEVTEEPEQPEEPEDTEEPEDSVSEGPGEPEVTEEPEQPDEPEDTEEPEDAVSEGPGEPEVTEEPEQPEEPEVTEEPEDSASSCLDGFIKVPGSTRCYKGYTDVAPTWQVAKEYCQAQGLELAEPVYPIKLRETLNDKYGDMYFWLDGQGNGSGILFQRGGGFVASGDSLWYPGYPSTSKDYCLVITAKSSAINAYPSAPYFTNKCARNKAYYPLCEAI